MSRRGIALGLLLILFFINPVKAGAASNRITPPARYVREIRIIVTDAAGRGLSGVKAEIKAKWGRLAGDDLLSDEQGRINISFQPVIEDPSEGLDVRDRYLVYRSEFRYRLSKSGFMSLSSDFKDEQDFASFEDPLYWSLNRMPSEDPVVVRVKMNRYRDFMAGGRKDPDLKEVVESVMTGKRNFRFIPGSVGRYDGGMIKMAIEFIPLFDPSEYGLNGAAAILLKNPVRELLDILKNEYRAAYGISSYEIKARAGFQYADAPFALPEERTFTYVFSSAGAGQLLDWSEGRPFPIDLFEVSLGGEIMDLTPELAPERIHSAPGSLLTGPKPDGSKKPVEKAE